MRRLRLYLAYLVLHKTATDIADVPLRARAQKLEAFVISQFTPDKLTKGDFEDVWECLVR